jgi:hypothetical protein
MNPASGEEEGLDCDRSAWTRKNGNNMGRAFSRQITTLMYVSMETMCKLIACTSPEFSELRVKNVFLK